MSTLRFSYPLVIRSSVSLLFVAFVLLFLGGLFVALSAKDTYYAHRLSTDGRMASATVIQKIMHRAAANGTSDTSYEVDYEFTTAEGRKVDSSDTVDPDTWERIADRGPVEVQYSASAPSINRIGATAGVTASAIVFLIVGCALGLIGATLAVKGLLALRAPVSNFTASAAGSITEGPPRWQVSVKVSPWIIIGAILLILGVIFRLIGEHELREDRLFQAGGVTATAIVVTKSSRVKSGPQSAHSQKTHYIVGYRFTSSDGTTVRASDEVDLVTWQSIRERDPIQIVYLRDEPAHSRLASDSSKTPQPVIVLGGTLAAVGALFLSYGLFTVMRRRRIGRQ
jgi:hypothetical protein